MYQQYLNSATAPLNYLDSDELKELLNDEEKLDKRVDEAVSSLEEEKEKMLVENRELATQNLGKEPEMIEYRGKIMDLTEQGKALCLQVQEKLSEMKSKSGDLNQDTALALLQAAEAESEEESEKIVKQLLDNEIPVDEFLDKFMQIRKIMHLRKLKSEKMQELVRQPNMSHTAGYPSFYPPTFGGTPGGGVPYPTGAMNMPMPGMYRPY